MLAVRGICRENDGKIDALVVTFILTLITTIITTIRTTITTTPRTTLKTPLNNTKTDAKNAATNEATIENIIDANGNANIIDLSPETHLLSRQAGGGVGTPPGAPNFFVMCTGQVEFGEVRADV